MALADQEGTMMLYTDGNNAAASSLSRTNVQRQELCYQVKVGTLARL